MLQMETEQEMVAAVLHDVIEDAALSIEYLTNLKPLMGKRTWTFTLPLKIMGLESCPVSVIGVDWEES